MDLNNGNETVVRPFVLVRVNRWRETNHGQRRLSFSSGEINRLEAIFIVGNLRHELPLEGIGNDPKKTELLLAEGRWSDEVIDVFCGFLQETPCHLASLILDRIPPQQLRRLLEAMHPNMSVKELLLVGIDGNDGALIEELLRHKTDFSDLGFLRCHFSISPALSDLFSGLPHLTKLKFESCQIDDEAAQAFLQGKYPALAKLVLISNQITSNGLGIMARRISEALPILHILNLGDNPDLLNDLENTQLFTQNIMPMLTNLCIQGCGQDSGYFQIIKACEAATLGKLVVLQISARGPPQAIRNQLIESLPKFKVKCFHCNCLRGYDQALVSALYKNTSIVQLGWIDDETRRHAAPILQRNKILANIKKHLLSGSTILTPLGRWSRVLAEVGHERVGLRATPVYMILQAVLAQWIEPTQLSQRPQQMLEQQGYDNSFPIESVAQYDSVQQQTGDPPPTVAAASAMAAMDAVKQQPCLGSKRRAAPTTANNTTKKKSQKVLSREKHS